MNTRIAMSTEPELAIISWHAHIYYDSATRPRAERVREGIVQRFKVQIGGHDVPTPPHAKAMVGVAFTVDVFADLVPWLALHRDGLSVLVHPNTLAPRTDNSAHALWLGPALPLRLDALPESIAASEEPPVVPNT